MNRTETLAKFASELRYEQLDKHVVERTKIVLLDAIGTMVSGSATEPGTTVISLIRSLDDKREASIAGTDHKVSYQNAAFVNASLVEILELQDGHRDSGLHPSSVIPATALAVSEYKPTNGRELVSAVVGGYELITRIGRAIRLSHVRTGTITTGNCGAFASAATACKLMGLDCTKMTNALGIAGYFAPLSLSGSYNGPTIKPLNAGQSAWVGVMSAFLASKGFTGSRNILSEFYTAMSSDIDDSLSTEGLGESFQITNLYFKRFPCCRFTHAAAEAALGLIADYPIQSESIESIVVKTFRIATDLGHYTNMDSNYVECQFSIPYIIAAIVLDRQLDLEQFAPRRIADPMIHEFAKKINVVFDKNIEEQFPKKYASTVTIRMRNGETYTRHVDHPKGDPENPLTDGELIAKFRKISMPVLGKDRTNSVIEKIGSIEDEPDAAVLPRLLH